MGSDEVEGRTVDLFDVTKDGKAIGEGIWTVIWSADLNADGALDLALRDGGAGAGTWTGVFVNCGADNYTIVFGPDYLTDVRRAKTSRRPKSSKQRWVDLRVDYKVEVKGRRGVWRDDARTATLRFDGQRYRCNCGRFP
jgi:hypothetical protein